MAIIEDVNNRQGQHVAKNRYWAENEETVIRCKLYVGDYILVPPISVDTKRNMAEIAGNIGNHIDHIRFREECKLAQRCGTKLVILVENTNGYTCIDDVKTWINDFCAKCSYECERKDNQECINNDDKIHERLKKVPIQGARLAKAMKTMKKKYGVDFQFCHPDEAGKRVLEILKGER